MANSLITALLALTVGCTLAVDLDLSEEFLPTGCVRNLTFTYRSSIVYTTNGTEINLYCSTQFFTNTSSFDSLIGFVSTITNFSCNHYWWARFPDTGQCLPAHSLPGISCERQGHSVFIANRVPGLIFNTMLTVKATKDLDRVTFICDRGERRPIVRYNHTTLLVENVPETEPDLLPAQIITGITMGSALLILLLVQGIVLLYSSPDF